MGGGNRVTIIVDCCERNAAEKVPTRVHFRESTMRGLHGKTNHRVLCGTVKCWVCFQIAFRTFLCIETQYLDPGSA